MKGTVYDNYEVVVGLEVHAQLLTKSKMFCSDSTEYGSAPNTQVSPVSLALPGALPRLNKQAVGLAIKAGLALNCEITEYNRFARKHYFYADLPQGYQVSQDDTPICAKGYVDLDVNGDKKRIGITRIHIEEDTGKNNHDLDPFYSLLDLNRAGMPLIEIVTEPDFRSSDEVYTYLTELRKLVRYLDVCDGNMEEGSMRCDANVSVRLKGEKGFGDRVEVKNMNSIRNVKRAIDGEVKRQIDIIEQGGVVEQETRGFDPSDGSTASLRTKSEGVDYLFFPEPNLPPLIVAPDFIEKVREDMPPLPSELLKKFIQEYGLSAYDAGVLTDEKDIALYYLEATSLTKSYKTVANWIMGEVKSYLNQHAQSINDFVLRPKHIVAIIDLIESGVISSTGAKRLFEALIATPDADVLELSKELKIVQNSDDDQLRAWAEEVLAKFPDKVDEYRGGKKGLLGMFMGQVMKLSGGQADPKITNKILQELLES